MATRDYQNTQRGPIGIGLGVVAAGVAAAGFLLGGEERWLEPVLLGVAGLLLFLAFCFHSLTVAIRGDRLTIRFGPIPLFRKTVPLERVRAAEPARSTFIDGWGVHYVPGRGWIWNLWGFDCVALELEGGRRLRIGTDDPSGLARAVTDRIAAPSPTSGVTR